MVVGLAFVAVVVSSLFAQAMLVRYTAGHQPQHRAWAIALAMFALASAALATGSSTGWDNGTFRVFYLLGAVVNVPWLAMGTVYLLARERTARRVLWGLVLFTGFAAGVLVSAPMETVHGTAIPVGQGRVRRVAAHPGRGRQRRGRDGDHRRRAVVSAVRFARNPQLPDHGRLAGANALIALGTLVLSSGGLVQGVVGHDEAFALSLAVGITVVYAGFVLASGRVRARAPDPDRDELQEVAKSHGE